MARLAADLALDPELARTIDPAVDALEMTPVHHAVAGGQLDALQLLISVLSMPLRNGARALNDAVALQSVDMVRLLLDRGADATTVRAGRWVLHPQLAPMLAAAG